MYKSRLISHTLSSVNKRSVRVSRQHLKEKMSFLNKTYTLDKNENFQEFLESLGISEEKKEVLLNFKPSKSLKKDGDEYIMNTTTPSGGSKDIKFKDCVEFDEEISSGIVGKTKFIVDGNVITQIQTFGDLNLAYRNEYSDDELVVIITTNQWDGTARRYYKAV